MATRKQRESVALITEIDAEKAKAQRERFKSALRARVDSVKWAKGSVVSAMKSLDERTKELDELKAMSAEEYCEKNPGFAHGGVVGRNNATYNCRCDLDLVLPNGDPWVMKL